eukprot:1802077-Pleurochrysis_carterae.AAC.1
MSRLRSRRPPVTLRSPRPSGLSRSSGKRAAGRSSRSPANISVQGERPGGCRSRWASRCTQASGYRSRVVLQEVRPVGVSEVNSKRSIATGAQQMCSWGAEMTWDALVRGSLGPEEKAAEKWCEAGQAK